MGVELRRKPGFPPVTGDGSPIRRGDLVVFYHPAFAIELGLWTLGPFEVRWMSDRTKDVGLDLDGREIVADRFKLIHALGTAHGSFS